MTNKKCLTVVILAAPILCALMTSLFVIMHEADHDCIGENCPVCAVIAVCQNTLKTLGGIVGAAALAFACFCFAASVIAFFLTISYNKTPVSLKVKLLN